MNYEKDFPMLRNDIVYFDNAATTFKPKCVIESLENYLINYNSNIHRGSYDISFKASDQVEESRISVQKFINADNKNEIVFTSGATDSINKIVFGFFKYYLKEGDEILLTQSEHASNILPWIKLASENKLIIKYVELDKHYKISLDNIKKCITNKTKVISLAYITNVIGDIRDIKSISNYVHNFGICVVVDGAQSVGHIKTDVKEIDADFFAFSAHKMYGPEGVGVLYGKMNYLKRMIPFVLGGGMNKSFDKTSITLESVPYRFEAGTVNIGGIIALKSSIDYLNSITFEYITNKEKHLRKYLIGNLKLIPYINIYNEESDSAIVLINCDEVLSSTLSLYLNSKKICTRSGMHCARLLNNSFDATVRISLSFYNTYEQIDYLVSVLSNINEIKKY